ncbi:MAG: TonB-dependent receptor, partial [Pseudomonadota bacterium]
GIPMRLDKRLFYTVSASAVVVAMTYSAPIFAQEQETGATETIIVTAQKREQSLQDVPIAVTVFDEQAIEIQRIDELQDYVLKTPNVGFIETGNRSRARLGIRGITNLGGDTNTTGIYIDEFNVAPSSSTRTFDVNLFDVERIEVLRGPQGTFFGRNTLGGALNITTKKPSADSFSGNITGEYGTFDHRMVKSSINAPLSDKAALRASAYYQADDGYIDNVGPSGRGNDHEDVGARLAIRVTPTDNWTIDASGSYVKYKQGANNTVPNGRFLVIQLEGYVDLINAAVDSGAASLPRLPVDEVGFLPQNEDTISTNTDVNSENETFILTLRNIFDIGEHSLTSVTGYIETDYFELFDGDQSSFNLIESSLTSELKSFSQEIRLDGPIAQGLYTLGFLYADDEISSESLQVIMNDGVYFPLFAAASISEGVFTRSAPKNSTRTLAAFGQIEWPLTEKLTVGVGGRYTNDKIENFNIAFGQTSGTVSLPAAEETFTDFSTSLVVTYEATDDATVYGSIKRAYKPGGVRVISLGEFKFDEEEAWTYELGLKVNALNGRLKTNSAIFYTDWTNLQVSARDPNAIASAILNAAEAENYGFEFEATAFVTDNFTVDLGFGYLEAELGSFPNALSEAGDLFDASGNRIPFSPKYSLSVGAQYDMKLGADKDAYIRAEYTYKDDQFGDVENTARGTNIFSGTSGDYEVTSRAVPSFGIVNLRAGVDFNDSVAVSISAENLLDEFYITGSRASSINLGGNLDAIGQPRTVVGRVSVDF